VQKFRLRLANSLEELTNLQGKKQTRKDEGMPVDGRYERGDGLV
jgi:hypothetical protein